MNASMIKISIYQYNKKKIDIQQNTESLSTKNYTIQNKSN